MTETTCMLVVNGKMPLREIPLWLYIYLHWQNAQSRPGLNSLLILIWSAT